MSKKASQKFVYIENTTAEENENRIPETNQNENKIEFSDLVDKIGISQFSENNQSQLKNNIKNFVKEKDKKKVEIKFDDSQSKIIERNQNYNSMVKDITKYQTKVKINREADVLDFTKNIQNQSTSAKSLINNNARDLNDFEKEIKNILVTNKYDTEEKIIKKENEELLKINPEELKKRYEEIKKMRFLLFQKEQDSKRKAKIKSKLYHKIKKKQREREEKVLLEKLGEVDPEAVNDYLEKKNIDRIKERIELKHSFNSKFNKTVKRYNLQNDLNVKEAIKENLKLRDELMKKIKGRENSEDEGNSDADENSGLEDLENESGDEISDGEGYENENSQEDKEEIKKENLLIDFDEDEIDNKKKGKNKSGSGQAEKSGVWAMKFMDKKKDDELRNKIQNVLEQVDSESFDLEDSDEENYKNKKFKNQKATGQKQNSNNDSAVANYAENNNGKSARRKNNLDLDENNNNNNEINNKNCKSKSKITNEILKELNDDAEAALKDGKKPGLSNEDLKKIVEIEEIKQDEELFNKFLVANETNKKEFLEKPKEKLEDNPNFLSGWNSWAGDSKEIQAKEFLRKKRYQQMQHKKNATAVEDPKANPYVKINNQFDKKFSTYLVQELPRNVRNEAEFEKLNQVAVGTELNSLTTYKKLIQPSIVKKIGQIIEPMKINDNTSAKKICDIIEKATKKKHRTKANM